MRDFLQRGQPFNQTAQQRRETWHGPPRDLLLGRVCKGVDSDEDGAEVEHGKVVGRALLVAGRQAPELLQAVEQALHLVAGPIRRTVEPRPTPLARLGRDHRPDAARAKVLA